MSAIPLYWYVESEAGGEGFKAPPWGVINPAPNTFFDTETGEIYSQAVLMGTLPWPRFRAFSTGEKVLLPFRAAVAFEQLEAATLASGLEVPFCCGCDDPLRKGSHYRVEITDTDVAVFNHFCGRHFPVSLDDRRAKPRHSPRMPPGEGGGVPVKGGEAPKACPLTGGAEPNVKAREPRVLD